MSYPFELYGYKMFASLNVDNATDEEYSEGGFNLSPPRSYLLTLGVQCVSGHDGTLQADLVQEHRQHRDLVRLHLDIDLAQDHAAVVIQRRQQMPARVRAAG